MKAIKKTTFFYLIGTVVLCLSGFSHLTLSEKDCSEKLFNQYLNFREAINRDELKLDTPLMDLRLEKLLAEKQVILNNVQSVAGYFHDLFNLLKLVNQKIRGITAYSAQCNRSKKTAILLLKVKFKPIGRPFTRFLIDFSLVDNDWKILSMHPVSQAFEADLDAGHTFRPLVMSFESTDID